MRKLLFTVTIAILLVTGARRSQAGVTVFLDYAGFTARLSELASAAGISSFSATEEAQIRSGIQSALETAYSGFDISFTNSVPTGAYETVNFGLTNSNGEFGAADAVDLRNQNAANVASVFTSNFDSVIENFEPRATQISELTGALAGTAQHQLGATVGGLMERDAYSDINYTGAGITTAGEQNTRIMASERTGLSEEGLESARSFSDLSLVKLAYGNSLLTGGPATIAEQSGANDSAATAQLLALTQLSVAPLSSAYVLGSLASSDDVDFYAFDATAGSTVSASILSDKLLSDDVDTVITIYDSDGTTVLATADDLRYNGNVLGQQAKRSKDGALFRVFLPSDGRYYLSVDSYLQNGAKATGNYELVLFTSSVPEPSALALLACSALGFGARQWRRRRQARRAAQETDVAHR